MSLLGRVTRLEHSQSDDAGPRVPAGQTEEEERSGKRTSLWLARWGLGEISAADTAGLTAEEIEYVQWAMPATAQLVASIKSSPPAVLARAAYLCHEPTPTNCEP